MLFLSLVTMYPFYKSYAKTDLSSLHYFSFIKPLAILITEAMSFDSEQFKNNSINHVIEAKNQIPFLAL
jgi:hypothetical protein